jgi:hypothetical protein
LLGLGSLFPEGCPISLELGSLLFELGIINPRDRNLKDELIIGRALLILTSSVARITNSSLIINLYCC